MATPKKMKPVEINGHLEPMLAGLQLGAIRYQLDFLLRPTGRV